MLVRNKQLGITILLPRVSMNLCSYCCLTACCANATEMHAGIAENPVQLNAAAYDNATNQQPEGVLGNADISTNDSANVS